MTRRIVVTGMGAVSPLAATLSDHHRLFQSGYSAVVPRTSDPPDGLASHWAPVRDDGLAETIGNRMLRKLLQRTAVMAVVAGGEALDSAALAGKHALLEDAGLYIGSVSFDVPQEQFVPALEMSVNASGDFDVRRFATRGVPQIDPLLIVKGLPNAGLCGIAIEHRVLGPNLNIANGSLGGAQAVAAAARAIACGEVDIAVAGAYDSLLQAEHLVAEKLSGRQSPPGEGAVMWVMESEAHAVARGARILAEAITVCESSRSLQDAITAALADSGVTPGHVFSDDPSPDEEGVTQSIGFAGAASALFSATHAALAITERRIENALVWHRDSAMRSVAIVLGAR